MYNNIEEVPESLLKHKQACINGVYSNPTFTERYRFVTYCKAMQLSVRAISKTIFGTTYGLYNFLDGKSSISELQLDILQKMSGYEFRNHQKEVRIRLEPTSEWVYIILYICK